MTPMLWMWIKFTTNHFQLKTPIYNPPSPTALSALCKKGKLIVVKTSRWPAFQDKLLDILTSTNYICTSGFLFRWQKTHCEQKAFSQLKKSQGLYTLLQFLTLRLTLQWQWESYVAPLRSNRKKCYQQHKPIPIVNDEIRQTANKHNCDHQATCTWKPDRIIKAWKHSLQIVRQTSFIPTPLDNNL